MNEVEARVTRHYGSDDLTQRILAALGAAGLDVDKLSADALFPFDQMHGRQLAATKEHVGRLALDPAKHVLDVGSGIGGPARYMAFTTGCRVTGIDLTEPFVAAAARTDGALRPVGARRLPSRQRACACHSTMRRSMRSRASTWR